MRTLVFLLIVCFPATGWSAHLQYALGVQISPHEGKITGTARITAYADMKLNLSVRNLRELNVDGVANVTTAHGSMNLSVQAGKEIIISYEALFTQKGTNFIDKDHVFLMDSWYPRPNVLVEYDLVVTLPENFIAISESESVFIQKHGKTKRFDFKFHHPLDRLHVAASTRYVLQKDYYNNIVIESYFFKEDARLADPYIAFTKKYLEMYETMLTPYPYKRFAIVENMFPTGFSIPTFSLLGKQVVKLPFIVKTSLGHEILHQWFGNSIFIDFGFGNWAEGITTYLSDHHYAALDGKDAAYRKQILLDYDAYVTAGNAIPLSDFFSRRNKAQGVIGYGKSAMLFHGLRELFGDELFFAAIRDFIHDNSFRKASWHDIQRAFEKITGKNLNPYFGYRLRRKDIPRLEVKNAKLRVQQGQLRLNFELLQKGDAYPLVIPVSLHTDTGTKMQFVHVKKSKEQFSLFMDEIPGKTLIDENYTMMRTLAPEEIPPVLAGIMGKQQLTVVVSSRQRCSCPLRL